MALSEFSFNLSFIRGVDNNIADAMSRLCRNNIIDSPDEYLNSLIPSVTSRSFKPNVMNQILCTCVYMCTSVRYIVWAVTHSLFKDRQVAQLYSWPLWRGTYTKTF